MKKVLKLTSVALLLLLLPRRSSRHSVKTIPDNLDVIDKATDTNNANGKTDKMRNKL